MLQAIKRMATRYNDYMTYVGRKRACEVLLRSNDRILEDAGFSRELLEKGADAWPWQATEPTQELPAVNFDKLTINKAVNELESYSDKDLHDLGITRGNITEAIVNGREGIERQDERKVA